MYMSAVYQSASCRCLPPPSFSYSSSILAPPLRFFLPCQVAHAYTCISMRIYVCKP